MHTVEDAVELAEHARAGREGRRRKKKYKQNQTL